MTRKIADLKQTNVRFEHQQCSNRTFVYRDLVMGQILHAAGTQTAAGYSAFARIIKDMKDFFVEIASSVEPMVWVFICVICDNRVPRTEKGGKRKKKRRCEHDKSGKTFGVFGG